MGGNMTSLRGEIWQVLEHVAFYQIEPHCLMMNLRTDPLIDELKHRFIYLSKRKETNAQQKMSRQVMIELHWLFFFLLLFSNDFLIEFSNWTCNLSIHWSFWDSWKFLVTVLFWHKLFALALAINKDYISRNC